MEANFLPIYDKDRCFFFALGRNAMYAVCRALGIGPGDEVLTPAFDCDSALQPFRATGVNLCFYRSDPYTFSIDIDDIAKKISTRTKLIHIINHFGIPQPWDKILAFRQKSGIPILEDNAYSLFSEFNGRPFGNFGDAAIFSLRKNLPLTDGGLLRINNLKIAYNHPPKKPPLLYRWEFLRLSGIIRDYFWVGNPHRITEPPSLYSDTEEIPEWSLRDTIGPEFSCDYLRPMSRLAVWQLSKLSRNNYNEICEKKRYFYAELEQGLRQTKGIKVLWPDLPEGIVPYCLPVLIERKRDIFLKVLRKKYAVMSWPTLSSLVLEQLYLFPEVKLLGKELLLINLPAQRVNSAGFPDYLDSLMFDFLKLAKKYL